MKLENGEDITAREQMALASLLAGMAFANALPCLGPTASAPR